MHYRFAVMHAGTLGIQNSKADSLSVPEELGLHSDTTTIQHISDILSLKKKGAGVKQEKPPKGTLQETCHPMRNVSKPLHTASLGGTM